jgi:hypothetical protein
MIEIIRIDLTTAADGTKTVTDNRIVNGLLHAVQLVDGDLADGVDLTLTCETGDLSIPLLTNANFNTDKVVYPRVLQHLGSDGSDLTTHTEPIVAGRIKAVLAQGGDTKTGAVICFIKS